MRYEESAPPADLGQWLQTRWVVTGEVGQPLRITPDGCTDLIALDDRAGQVLFVGPMTRASVETLELAVTYGVRFHPGTLVRVRPGLRLRELQDATLVLPGEPDQPDAPRGLLVLVRALAARGLLLRDPTVDAVLAALAEPGPPLLTAIYARLGLDERAVQRRFDRFVGLTPKGAAGVLRQTGVTRAIRVGAGGLAELASDHGYADQAHLTRDYREQVGISPGRYRAEIDGVDFVQDGASVAPDNGGRHDDEGG